MKRSIFRGKPRRVRLWQSHVQAGRTGGMSRTRPISSGLPLAVKQHVEAFRRCGRLEITAEFVEFGAADLYWCRPAP
jgi:hypothetical protein